MFVNAKRFAETAFADDFNLWQLLFITHKHIDSAHAAAFIILKEAQQELNFWGRANRVVLDPATESLNFLCRRFGAGNYFKFVGVTFDPALRGWRLEALLKVRLEATGSAACEVASETGWRL